MAFLLLFLYGLIRIIIMGVSLSNTYGSLEDVQSAAKTGDLGAISATLSKAVTSSGAAASAADDPIVQTWNWIPFLGSDMVALQHISRDGHKILQASQQVFAYTNNIKLGNGTGENGALKPETVRALRDAVVALNGAIHTANKNLGAIDPNSLHFGLGERVATAKALIAKTSDAMDVATPMVKIGAEVLATEGTQRWFIATQNLAEARAQGGIIGAYATLIVKNGKVSLDEFGSDVDLNKRGPINYTSYPEELRQLWGVDLTDWRDINASANAPYAGQLAYDGWKQHTGQSLAGVIFVGQGTVRHLVAASGEIKVRDNVLNTDNIVDFLSKDIYAKYPDVATKNAVVSDVMKVLFSHLTKQPINTSAFFASLANETTGDRLVAWASNKEVQQTFVQEGVSGQVPTNMGSHALVTVNNAGGNKLEAYAKVYVKYAQKECGQMTFDGYYARKSEIVVRVSNLAPKKGLPAYVTTRLDEDFGLAPRPKGSNRELISIYGPVGSEDAGFFVNGKDYFASAAFDRKRPVWVFDIELQPGETKTIKVKFLEPIADQNAELLKGSPSITPPVMLNPVRVEVAPGPQCSVQK
jgi:hypothetical protein